MIQNIFSKKRVVISLLIFLILGLIYYVYLILNTSTIIINSTNGSIISVKNVDDKTFIEIGTSNATYKTRSEDTLIFQASSGGQLTQKPVKPIKRETITVNLKFSDLIKPQLFSDLPVTHPLIKGGYLYGISPNSGSLIGQKIDNVRGLPVQMPLLPFLKQIAWVDEKNFFYTNTSRGGGIVEDGKFSVASQNYSVVSLDNGSMVLLGPEKLSLAQNLTEAKQPKSIANIPIKSSSSIFTEDDKIYLISRIYDNNTSEGKDLTYNKTLIKSYDGLGKPEKSASLNSEDLVTALASVDKDRLLMLQDNKINLYNFSTESSNEIEFSFGDAVDLIKYKSRFFILSSSGLWEYVVNDNRFSRVSTFPENQEYVPESLTLIDDALYFSTVASEQALMGQSTAKAGVYKIEL